jgi:hypothetical protein
LGLRQIFVDPNIRDGQTAHPFNKFLLPFENQKFVGAFFHVLKSDPNKILIFAGRRATNICLDGWAV